MQNRAPETPSINHRPARVLGCLIAACALAPVAVAVDNPGAHEHGQARLQMAVENSQVDLMFTSPAYNLAGFEHEARTDEQKKQLADIRQWLATTPLINTEAGACRVTAVNVKLSGESGSHQQHDHHEESHHDDEEEHQKREEETHRDYEVAQQLTCDGMAAGDAFTSPLPARFPELEGLAVEWVGTTGQGGTVITRPSQSFKLGQ